MLPKEVFTESELKIIKEYAVALYQKTTTDDLTIFIGRSPWIVSHYWKTKSYEVNYYCVSFSGNPYDEKVYPEGRSPGPSKETLDNLMKDYGFETEKGAGLVYDYLFGIGITPASKQFTSSRVGNFLF